MKLVLACALTALILTAPSALAQDASGGSQASKTENARAFGELVAKAETARKADQTDEAIRIYHQVVHIKPDYVEGWWYLGTLNYEMDRYPEGTAAFSHVAGLKPNLSLAWAMWGLCEFETKDYSSALVHLEHANQLGIPNEQSFYEVARYHLAILLTRSGRFEEAMKIMAEFALHGKQTPDYDEAMGLAMLRKPLLPRELPPLERAMVVDVGHSANDMAARRQTDLKQDIELLLSKYPNSPNIHFVVGTLELTSNSDKAIEDWKEELKITPNHAQALISLAAEYLKLEDFKSALPYAAKAAEVDPQDFEPHALLGQVLLEGDIDIPRAIFELEDAVKMDPQSPQVHFALARAYAKAGRKEDAARERSVFLKLRGQGAVAVSESK